MKTYSPPKRMTVYKLTDADMRTYRGYQWILGETRRFPGHGKLCTAAYCHAYRDPLLAVCMAPAHVSYRGLRLFSGSALVELDDGTKLGCVEFTPKREIALPALPPVEALVRWAIYCAREYDVPPDWLRWARSWLSGRDRTSAAAACARYDAAYAGYTASAALAAEAAARARYDAAHAAAAYARYDAAYAGYACARFDALKLLRRAIRDEARYQARAAGGIR